MSHEKELLRDCLGIQKSSAGLDSGCRSISPWPSACGLRPSAPAWLGAARKTLGVVAQESAPIF